MTPALHQDTLRVAHVLLKGKTDDLFAVRRAVSSAYYALFQDCAQMSRRTFLVRTPPLTNTAEPSGSSTTASAGTI